MQARDSANEPPEFPDADRVTPGVQKNQVPGTYWRARPIPTLWLLNDDGDNRFHN